VCVCILLCVHRACAVLLPHPPSSFSLVVAIGVSAAACGQDASNVTLVFLNTTN
jgi:hypothetical protein